MSPIPDEHLEFSFFRSSGPGGQKKNVTDAAVRLRHRPTGIVVVAQRGRSQQRNKQLALEELERRLAARRRRKKPRIASKPSRAAQARRIEAKRHQADKKRLRSRPADTE